MTTVRRELPHIIKPSLKGDALARAIQENFDHLSGEVVRVNKGITETFNSPAIREIAEDIVNNTEIEDAALRAALAGAGVGEEDGSPPTTPTNLRVIGGIGNWIAIIWDGVVNTSPVTYNVYAHTSTGYTADATKWVGSFTIPGGAVQGGLTVRKFPSTHTLANHDVDVANTYYVRVAAEDGDGESAASAEVSASPVKIDASSIITAGTIVTNLMTADSIHGDRISGGTITAGKLSVGSLAAISATLGAVTAGTITSSTITSSTFEGGTFRSSSDANNRIEMNSGLLSLISITQGGAFAGYVSGSGGNGIYLTDSSGVTRLAIQGSTLALVAAGGTVTIAGNTALHTGNHSHGSIPTSAQGNGGHSHTISNPGPLNVTGTSGAASAGTAHTHGAGSYEAAGHGHGGSTGSEANHTHTLA